MLRGGVVGRCLRGLVRGARGADPFEHRCSPASTSLRNTAVVARPFAFRPSAECSRGLLAPAETSWSASIVLRTVDRNDRGFESSLRPAWLGQGISAGGVGGRYGVGLQTVRGARPKHPRAARHRDRCLGRVARRGVVRQRRWLRARAVAAALLACFERLWGLRASLSETQVVGTRVAAVPRRQGAVRSTPPLQRTLEL